MPNFTLTAQSPLGGYERDFENVSLTERTKLALISIATPLDGQDELNQALRSAFGITLPAIACSSYAEDGNTCLLGLQSDQAFLMFEDESDHALATVEEKLGKAGYYTDQSDSWVVIRMSGTASTKALERICMLDLSLESFVIGGVARTIMEHLAVIIHREDSDSFLLMSPRSSAKSFLHTLELSITNIS